MDLTLKGFQTDAVREMLSRLDTAKLGYRGGAGQRQAVGLTATTGAGKTIIAAAIIEAILFGSDAFGVEPDTNAVFLWMTDLPELNVQTQAKILGASPRLRFLVSEITSTFNAESLAPGRVYFLNTQKLGAKKDLVKHGPLVERNFTFWEVVRKTIETEGSTFYLVVDEAHRGMTETKKIDEANSIIQRFIKGYPEAQMPAVPIVLGISATPDRFMRVVENSGRTTSRWDVPADEVRASGLIKDRMLADYAGEKQTDAMALFPDAVKAWQTSTKQWSAYHAAYDMAGDEPLVIPALIVQVENETAGRTTATDLNALMRIIVEISGPLHDSAFAHSFGEGTSEPVGARVIRYLEPSKIAGDSDARVVFFKTSLDTGWDCPRAEVMFSFRRAVDPTSIAQTIGRMVRTPLARRIEENHDLNSASVFLPFYDGKGVEAIVSRLNESGNEAIARSMVNRRETISLPRRKDADQAVAAIEAIPSYLVPTPRSRSEIRVLADLANFLSSSGIDPEAYRREMHSCAMVLMTQRETLADDADFAAEVNESGEIAFRRAELILGEKATTDVGSRTLPATEESIGRLFELAARRLTNEAASAYVRARLGQDGSTIGTARLEAYALATRDVVMDEVNAMASTRIDALRADHGGAINSLSPVKQGRYRAILRQAKDPTLISLHLPDTAIYTRGTEPLPANLYAGEDGEAAIFLNSWEKYSIGPEAVKPHTLGWLRNGDRDGWFCVPWRDGTVWRGFFPDFLVVHENGDRILVDIIDPHDHTKPDALGKAQGLSAYAAKHGDQLGHVDLIAKVGARYCRLHLEKSGVRKQIDDARTLSELRNLYLRRG
jgi:type III restriction enzyme